MGNDAQLNSVKDLIIFNDHQYTKNTIPTAVPNAVPTTVHQSTNLPPLSIEEILNDNQTSIEFDQQFSQDLDPNYCIQQRTATFFNSLESPCLESNANYLNDDYLNFNFDQPAVSFDF